MYSVISLANFGIKHPVFNAGFGVERLAMVTEDVDDVRELIYPQFYTHTFTNREIENSISFVKNPSTAKGYVIAEKIEEILRKYKDEIAPCEYTVFEDDEVKVRVVEKEEGKNLLGPAALNEIYVEEGSILSRVESKQDKDELKYIKGITLGVAAQIEENLSKGKKQDTIRIRMARSLSDINLQIPDRVQDYITGEHKRIKVGGPVFLTVEYLKKQGQGKNI